MKKIGIFYICIGRYTVFWRSFYQSAEQYLFSDDTQFEKHYFIFTDRPDFPHFQGIPHLHITNIEKEPWPFPTLKRWHYFLEAEEQWKDMDYVYFCNANFLFLDHIDSTLLPKDTTSLVCVTHPAFPPSEKDAYTYDRNPQSTAYIVQGEGDHYLMGSFHGGTSQAYADMCRELKSRTDSDLSKNLIALWHDESHLNRFAIDHKEMVYVLPYDTLSVEYKDETRLHSHAKILIQEKSLDKWGGHEWLRGVTPNKIISKLRGGLGNQLWQYCAAIALYSLHMDEGEVPEVWINISSMLSNRSFLLDKIFSDLNIDRDSSVMKAHQYVKYKDTHTFMWNESFFSLPPAVILEGYFQHYRYFELARPYLNLHLQSSPQKYKDLQKEGYELVALHVRRGDYLKEAGFIHGLVPLDYYKECLRQISQRCSKPYVLIFSDEIDWVRKYVQPEVEQWNLPFDYPEGDEIGDFCLMAECQYFILANSTFSIFAALIGSNQHSLVFTPRMHHLSLNVPSRRFLPSSWESPQPHFYRDLPSHTPKVSVIIPVSQSYEYLERCLELVCGQTEQDIEIIVVDDASTDHSWELIQEYKQRDSRIVAIRHEHALGVGGAKNTGIEVAKGEWLFFLQVRNYLLYNTIEDFLRKGSEYTDAEILVGNMMFIHDRGEEISQKYKNRSKTLRVTHPYKHFKRDQSYLTVYSGDKLWKRDLWHTRGIRFPEHTIMEDFSVIPKMVMRAKVCAVVSSPLCYFPINGQDSVISLLLLSTSYPFDCFPLREEDSADDVKAKVQEILMEMEKLSHKNEGTLSHAHIAMLGRIYKKELLDMIEHFFWNNRENLTEDEMGACFHDLAEYKIFGLKKNFSTLYKKQLKKCKKNYRGYIGQQLHNIWVVGRVISKTIGIYPLIRPLATLIRKSWTK